MKMAVLGILTDEGYIMGVTMDSSQTVLELKKEVALLELFTDPPSRIRLFLAKRSDGSWLQVDDPDLK
jgi:hypothetical protein